MVCVPHLAYFKFRGEFYYMYVKVHGNKQRKGKPKTHVATKCDWVWIMDECSLPINGKLN